jgi:hypothetical protein
MLISVARTEKRLTIARLILNQQTDISLLVWGVSLERAVLGQFEVGLGAVPGGNPMARLAGLMGRWPCAGSGARR